MRVIFGCIGLLLLMTVAGTILLHLPISRAGDIGVSLPRAVALAAAAVSGTGIRMSVGPAELTAFGQLTLTALMLGGAWTVLSSVSRLTGPMLQCNMPMRWHITTSAVLLIVVLSLGFTLTPRSSTVSSRLLMATSIATATGWRLGSPVPDMELLAVVPSIIVMSGPILFARWLRSLLARRWPERLIVRHTAGIFVGVALVSFGLFLTTGIGSVIPAATGLLGTGAQSQILVDMPRWMLMLGPIAQFIGLGPTGLGSGPGLYLLMLIAAQFLQLFRGILPAHRQRILALFILFAILNCAIIAILLATLTVIAPQLPAERQIQLVASALTSSGWTTDPLAISGSLGLLLAIMCLTGKVLSLWMLAILQPAQSDHLTEAANKSHSDHADI